MSAQPAEQGHGEAQVPLHELRRLRALARIASPQELAEAEEAARLEELDALEAAGQTGQLPDEQARQILGLDSGREDESYLAPGEVRRHLGL